MSLHLFTSWFGCSIPRSLCVRTQSRSPSTNSAGTSYVGIGEQGTSFLFSDTGPCALYPWPPHFWVYGAHNLKQSFEPFGPGSLNSDALVMWSHVPLYVGYGPQKVETSSSVRPCWQHPHKGLFHHWMTVSFDYFTWQLTSLSLSSAKLGIDF